MQQQYHISIEEEAAAANGQICLSMDSDRPSPCKPTLCSVLQCFSVTSSPELRC